MTNNHEKMNILLPVSDIHFGARNMTKEQLAESLMTLANYAKSDSLPICLDGEDEYRTIQPRATDTPKTRDFAHQADEHALIKRRVKKDFFIRVDTLVDHHGHYHDRNDIKGQYEGMVIPPPVSDIHFGAKTITGQLIKRQNNET